MATLTVFAPTSDAGVDSTSVTYATARSGAGLTLATGTSLTVGQAPPSPYFIDEFFILFDTSPLTSAANVSAATLSLWLKIDNSTQDFTCEARIKAWGPTVTTADWVAGASLGALTRVATLNTSGIGATGAYKAFTEDGTNFIANVSKTATTELLVDSSRHVGNNAPTVAENVTFASADTAGTTNDPMLTVTYTLPAAKFLAMV